MTALPPLNKVADPKALSQQAAADVINALIDHVQAQAKQIQELENQLAQPKAAANVKFRWFDILGVLIAAAIFWVADNWWLSPWITLNPSSVIVGASAYMMARIGYMLYRARRTTP